MENDVAQQFYDARLKLYELFKKAAQSGNDIREAETFMALMDLLEDHIHKTISGNIYAQISNRFYGSVDNFEDRLKKIEETIQKWGQKPPIDMVFTT